MTDYTKYKTDKVHGHNYMAAYEHHFAPFRDRQVNLLEIGIEYGHSIELWKDFFRHPGTGIAGLDLGDCGTSPWPHVEYFQGDMKDTFVLEKILGSFNPLSIVIDDASHQAKDSMIAFNYLFPRLAPGGLYVVEDLRMDAMLHSFLFPNIHGWNFNPKCMTIYMPNGGESPFTGIVFIEKRIDGA